MADLSTALWPVPEESPLPGHHHQRPDPRPPIKGRATPVPRGKNAIVATQVLREHLAACEFGGLFRHMGWDNADALGVARATFAAARAEIALKPYTADGSVLTERIMTPPRRFLLVG